MRDNDSRADDLPWRDPAGRIGQQLALATTLATRHADWMRRRRQLVKPTIALAWAAPALLLGCIDGKSELQQRLESSFRAAAADSQPVDLGAVADFEWDRVVFVCPYERQQEVDERLGFRWRGFPAEYADHGREGVALLVFVSNDHVEDWTEIGRNLGDPCAHDRKMEPVLSRDEATIWVDAGDPSHLILSSRPT